MFRREQACRRITTRHHQGCFRHRAAVAQHPVQPDAIVRLRVQIHRLDRLEQPALPDFRFPIAAGIAARHPCPLRPRGLAIPPRLNNSSTGHSKTAASASAVATDGERRSPSMAPTAAREMPARSANSACDQWRVCRRSLTGLNAIFLSLSAIFMSLRDK